MLRCDQFGTVHIHQRIAFFYRLAGGVDIEPLDPALEFWRYRIQAALVRLYRGHCPHGAGEFAQRDSLRSYPQLLYFFGLIFTAELLADGSSPS